MSRHSLWSYSWGRYGHTVRVFERKGRINLSISFTDRLTGKLVKSSLGHADRARAKLEARELAEALAQAAPSELASTGAGGRSHDQSDFSSDNPRPNVEDALVWDTLFGAYAVDESARKKGAGPAEDERRTRMWTHYMKESGIAGPGDLDQTYISRFVDLRRAGRLNVPGIALKNEARPDLNGNAVSDRTVHADIVFLMTVLNWAKSSKKTRGKPWLRDVPISMPVGLKKKPRKRPVAVEEDVRAIRRVADRVDSQRLYGCFIRLHDDLGWRVTAMGAIKASEVSLVRTAEYPWGLVMKNEYVDKEGVGDRVPMSKHAFYTMLRLFRLRGIRPGDEVYLFPAKRKSGACWSRWHISDLQNAAEEMARIQGIGGTHAVRRKWVNERKHHPLPDIMAAGGWTDIRSLPSYLKADPGTMYDVVSRKTGKSRRAPVNA